MASKERLEWVDIAKAFAIIAVVLGHISYQYPEIALLPIGTIMAWLWHVPVFFMIGGFFLKEEKLVKPAVFIKGKIRSLYLLILYIYIPFTLLHNVLLDVGFYDTAISYGGKYVDYWTVGQFVRGCVEVVFLAGREPIVGAMWFVYVLFMALCYLSLLSFILKKITPPYNEHLYEQVRCCVLLLGAVVGSILTNIFDFTIPRFNNVFTASWLIYIGMQIVQRYKVRFDNYFVFGMSLIAFYSFCVLRGGVSLNRNRFDDIVSLTASTFAALYLIAFVSKRSKGWFAKVMSVIGKESFYIMGFHFLAFKLCSLAINQVSDLHQNVAELEAPATNLLLYVYYALGGVFLPLAFIWAWRKIWRNVIKIKFFKSCL
ncbi:MAG: acyltransferase family protein [Prevotella sp.]|nr:acyltransferase family protein [Prevotella sp.]